MQLDNRKHGRNPTVIADPQRHFPFDCRVGKGRAIERFPCSADLAFVEVAANWTFHPELRDGARPSTANLIADNAVARRHPQR